MKKKAPSLAEQEHAAAVRLLGAPSEEMRAEESAPRAAPLLVHTARLSGPHHLPGLLDVTRKTGREGLPFAPSWGLLAPYLDKRRAGGGSLLDLDWSTYREGYLEEMRASFRRVPGVWAALLARPAVVLGCYCADPLRCHRTVLAEAVLVRLGAVYAGEVGEAGPVLCEWCSTGRGARSVLCSECYYSWAERAAILQYQAGQPRPIAEAEAVKMVLAAFPGAVVAP